MSGRCSVEYGTFAERPRTQSTLTSYPRRSHAILRKMFVVLTITLVVGVAGLPVDAQDSKDPKGITVRNLVTCLGGFSATVNAPILITCGAVALGLGVQTRLQPCQVL